MQRDAQLSQLRRYIADEAQELLATLRHYLLRAQLDGDDAGDLLQETIVEALRHEARFARERSPRAWLLGIAANIIRRRQVEGARRGRREPLARDLTGGDEVDMSDDELFDRWQRLAADGRGKAEDTLAVRMILAELPPDDQRILRLAIWHGLDGDALGLALGISAGAARVRLHRALRRARPQFAAWRDDEE